MSVAIKPGKLGVFLSDDDHAQTPHTAAVHHGEASRQPVTPAVLAARQSETDYTGLALGAAACLVIYLIVMKG